MRQPRENGFSERRKSADEAKLRLLKKFQAAPKPDDPIMVAKRAERAAIVTARDDRRAERARVKRQEAERQAAEAAALVEAEAKAKAEAEAKVRAEEEERKESQKRLVAQVIANEAERKAKRDQRYAARKARQR